MSGVTKEVYCGNCGHLLLKHIDPKTKRVTWLHFNRFHFGKAAINHEWCSVCEVIGEECNRPQVKT